MRHNSCLLTSTLSPCWRKLFAILALKMLLKSPVFSKVLHCRSATAEGVDYTGSISATARYFTMLEKTSGMQLVNSSVKTQSCYSRFLLMFVYALLILYLFPAEDLRVL